MCTHTGARTHTHTHTLRLSCLPKIRSQLPPGQATLTFAPPGRSHKTRVSFHLRTHCVPSLTPDVPPRPGLWAPGSPLSPARLVHRREPVLRSSFDRSGASLPVSFMMPTDTRVFWRRKAPHQESKPKGWQPDSEKNRHMHSRAPRADDSCPLSRVKKYLLSSFFANVSPCLCTF